MKRILLIGGGSGGHVYPLIAVARSLKEKAYEEGINLRLELWGDGGFARIAAKENGLPFKTILSGKWRRYVSVMNFADILKFILGFIQSLWLMYWYMPDLIFAKGGYTSVPPVLVGRLYRIPVVIHESDAVPGIANRILARFARKILVAFEKAQRSFRGKETVLVGNPVRDNLLAGNRDEAMRFFNLNPEKKTVLFLGGSQGAKKINDFVLAGIVVMAKKFQIIHQCGEANYEQLKKEKDRYLKEGEKSFSLLILDNYRLFAFFGLDQLALAYAAADVIVSRAGAGLISEIALLGKPSLLIPLSNSAGDHQLINAVEFRKYGAVIVEEQNLSLSVVINQLDELLKPENYHETSEKIRGFAKPDAADKIAGALLDIIRRTI